MRAGCAEEMVMHNSLPKLDWTRMLGFDQIADTRATVAYVSDKLRGKVGVKIGGKLGLKAGLKA